MKLRGHHLFCTTLFSGHGYSEEFTAVMNQLLNELCHRAVITLCTEADFLCKVCPNREENGGCALGSTNAQERDFAALSVLAYTPGQSVLWADAQQKMLSMTELQFQQVCGDCRWQKQGLCSLDLLKRHAGQYLKD